jgi:hypothetical protein
MTRRSIGLIVTLALGLMTPHGAAAQPPAQVPRIGVLLFSPGAAASRARCTRSPSGRQRLSGGGAGGEKGLWNSYPR